MRNLSFSSVFRSTHRWAFVVGLLVVELLAAPGCEVMQRGDSEPVDVRLAERLESSVRDEQIQGLKQLAHEPLFDHKAQTAILQSARRLAKHSDSKLRQTAITTLAQRHDPKAFDLIETATEDDDLEIRTAAIRALGILGGPDANRLLARLLSDELAVIRSEAIRACAALGQYERVREASDDPSWRVRLVVAEMLAGDHSPEADEIAQRFLKSRNSPIQQQIVTTIAAWPLRRAGPLLFSAIESDSYMTSKRAAEQFVRRWPAARILSVEPVRHTNPAQRLAMETKRAATIKQLRQLWQAEFPATSAVGTKPRSSVRPPKAVSPESVLRIKRLLDQLADTSLPSRRRGAVAIAKYRKHHKLDNRELTRLSELLTGEGDPTVWLALLPAIDRDTRPAARRLLFVAMSHPHAEVRRRACQALGETSDPQYQSALLLSLEDASPSVMMAALQGLANTGPIADPGALVKLLRHSDTSLRLAAATTLAKLGRTEGRDALERMAHDRDPRLRRQMATVMGQIGHQTFIPTLIEILNDRTPVQQAALGSLRQITGKDFRHNPDGSLASQASQVRSWRRWHSATMAGG